MFEESVSNSSSIWASMNSWFTPTVLFVLLNLMIGTILFSSNLSTSPQQQNQENQEHKQEDSTHTPNQQNDQNAPVLQKSPSVLQRIKSINFKSFTDSLDSDTTETEQHLNHELQSAIETQTHYIFDDHQTLTTQAQFSFEQTHQESSLLTESQPQIQQPHEEDSTELEDVVPQNLDEVYSHFDKLTDTRFSRTTSDTKPASGEVLAKLSAKMKKSASMKSPFAHFEENDIMEAVEARRPVTVRERGSKVTDADEEVDAKADDFINKFKQQLKLQRIDSIMRYKEVINRGAK